MLKNRNIVIMATAAALAATIGYHISDAGIVMSLSGYCCSLGIYSPIIENLFTVGELIRFVGRMLPGFLFQAVAGIAYYKYYCTSSVYVFSRVQDKTKWYLKSMAGVLTDSAIYQALFSAVSLLSLVISGKVTIDAAGTLIYLYYIIIWVLWNFLAAVLMNIIAIKAGSAVAFICTAGIQFILLIVLLPLGRIEEVGTVSLLARLDPIIVLMPGQHRSFLFPYINNASLEGIYAEISILIVMFLTAVTLAAGCRIVESHDLLAADAESNGV